MNRKRSIVSVTSIIVVVILVMVGYNIYRYPSLFRDLNDSTLSEEDTRQLVEEIRNQQEKKILVAYLSNSGTTQSIAQEISIQTEADLFEIAPETPYSNLYIQSNSEIRNNRRPELNATVDNMEQYDVVFVGYPVWWHATPAPINTFLESYDLTGKIIIPFCTSGGSDIEETLPTFLNSCEDLAVYGARRIVGIGQVNPWLEELQLFEQIQATTEYTSEPSTYEFEIIEQSAWRDGNHIYGVMYRPIVAQSQVPAIIYAHGYGVTHANGIQYAERLAALGYAVYCFDFGGGSERSQSDGTPLEMSIFTQQQDLEAVIDMVADLEYVDEDNVFLFGASQGGAISGITAANNKEKLQGLILLYPAFELVETVQGMYETVEEIPDTVPFMWMTVGKMYFQDLLEYRIYDVIGAYDKEVLLIHGDADGIVELSSSTRATQVYESSQLKIIEGAGHGLSGQETELAVEYMWEYYQGAVERVKSRYKQAMIQ